MPDTTEQDVTVQVYRESCDASAAVRLGDSPLFATASDEDYVLRVYDSTNPGEPVDRLDVTEHLAPDDPDKEPDIEGAALVRDRVYWITSHGLDGDGLEQESRQRLFATQVVRTAVAFHMEPTGRAYTKLRRDLARATDLTRFKLGDAAAIPPQSPGGLNMEGLTATPDGHLLVGFRNPIREGRALVVRLRNAADLIDGRADAANLSLAGALDLGGRGIRAFEFVPALRSYLLLAGAFDDSGDFALFRWSGDIGDPAMRIVTDALADLNPEELIVTSGAGPLALDVFSDDGDRRIGTKKCKKLAEHERRFRVARFTLPLF